MANQKKTPEQEIKESIIWLMNTAYKAAGIHAEIHCNRVRPLLSASLTINQDNPTVVPDEDKETEQVIQPAVDMLKGE